MQFSWNNDSPLSHSNWFHAHLRISFSLFYKVCCKIVMGFFLSLSLFLSFCFFLSITLGYRNIFSSLPHLLTYSDISTLALFLQHFRGVWSSFKWLSNKTIKKRKDGNVSHSSCSEEVGWSGLFFSQTSSSRQIQCHGQNPSGFHINPSASHSYLRYNSLEIGLW